MATKTINLIVPSSFQVPTFLCQATPEQVEQVLLLANAFLEKGSLMSDDCSQEKYRNEAIRIVKHEQKAAADIYEKLLDERNKKIEDLKSEKLHLLEEKNQYIEYLKTEKQQLYKKLDEKDHELKEERHSFQRKLDEKEQKNTEIQEKLQQRIAIQSNSSKRGQEGEKDFEMITSNMKQWTLESVGKTKESADFRLILHSMEVRFEVKNHETVVPYSKNVDKFERDMKQHTSARLGVFVAMKAGIEKFDESITLRWTDDKQLLVFIPYFLSRDLTYTYDMIEGLARTMRYLKPFLETKDVSKDIDVLRDKITMAITTIQTLDKQVSLMYKDHQEYNMKTVANYKSLQSYILSTLTILTGKEQEEVKPKSKSRGKKKEILETSE